jgi:L-asparaginase
MTTLFLKDSVDISTEDRALLIDVVSTISSSSVLVIHGTDTMVRTAQRLAEIPNKTIITVGAFIPHSIINSDAEFNLGAAMAYSQVLPYGSYIAMNGMIYPHDHVEKDYEAQCFKMQ